jgi:hypothetical protein
MTSAREERQIDIITTSVPSEYEEMHPFRTRSFFRESASTFKPMKCNFLGMMTFVMLTSGLLWSAFHVHSVYSNEHSKAMMQREQDQSLLIHWCKQSDHNLRSDHCTLAAVRSKNSVENIARQATWIYLTEWIPEWNWCHQHACFERAMMVMGMVYWPIAIVCVGFMILALALLAAIARGMITCGCMKGWCVKQKRTLQRKLKNRSIKRTMHIEVPTTLEYTPGNAATAKSCNEALCTNSSTYELDNEAGEAEQESNESDPDEASEEWIHDSEDEASGELDISDGRTDDHVPHRMRRRQCSLN